MTRAKLSISLKSSLVNAVGVASYNMKGLGATLRDSEGAVLNLDIEAGGSSSAGRDRFQGAGWAMEPPLARVYTMSPTLSLFRCKADC